MLPSSPHVQNVYMGEGNVIATAPKGALVIDCSTIDPGTARTVATSATEAGVRVPGCCQRRVRVLTHVYIVPCVERSCGWWTRRCLVASAERRLGPSRSWSAAGALWSCVARLIRRTSLWITCACVCVWTMAATAPRTSRRPAPCWRTWVRTSCTAAIAAPVREIASPASTTTTLTRSP